MKNGQTVVLFVGFKINKRIPFTMKYFPNIYLTDSVIKEFFVPKYCIDYEQIKYVNENYTQICLFLKLRNLNSTLHNLKKTFYFQPTNS